MGTAISHVPTFLEQVVVFVKSQILNQKHSQENILLFLAAFLCNFIFKLLNKTFSKLKTKRNVLMNTVSKKSF